MLIYLFTCLFQRHILLITWLFLGRPGVLAAPADPNCEAALPCTCTEDRNNQYVHCDGLGLSIIPTFYNASGSHREMHLDLQNNAITSVKTYAFKNLNHTHLSSFRLHMDNNQISALEKDAFMGYEGSLIELYLSNNKITSIPTALGNLTRLAILDLTNNSLTSFEVHTMNQIGKTLFSFSFGDVSMSQWPSELRFFRVLQTLNVYYMRLTALPQDAFHGFSQTLQTLRIDSTNVGSLLPAICHLTKVKSFYYDNNDYYHGRESIFEPCPSALGSLRTLHMSNDNLKHFPPVFVLFPNITSLYIINNPALFYVDDSLIPANTKLETLYLYENGLTRVPEAVQKIPLLATLDLHSNQIRLIEAHDVNDMDSLQTLRLDGNPIKYISSSTFQNLPQLFHLWLNGTSLTKFPQAISAIGDLRDLYLPDDQIECNCDIAFLKNWHTRANIRGNCESSAERINDFVRNGLHSCPLP